MNTAFINKPFTLFVPVSKVDEEQRMVYGYASTEAVDSDGEIVTLEALEGALPGYMQFGNLREMHQLIAVGKVKEAEIDGKGLYIGAKVVDDDAWNKVKEEVLSGFSIGGSATKREGNSITGLDLIEISLVDRPANPEALIEVFKAAAKPAPVVNDNPVEQARANLLKVVSELPAEEVIKAFAAFEKRKKTEEVEKPEEDKSEEKAEDDKEKPEGDYGTHAEAGYADPGYQADKKPRYPLKEGGKWSEERIRAAWNYINKPKNQKPYSSEEVSEIKNRVISAWKKHIDAEGPPSAEDGKKKADDGSQRSNQMSNVKKGGVLASLGEPDARKGIAKGMGVVSSAIYLLESLNYLQERLEAEEAIEGDSSPLPTRFDQLLQMLASLVEELVEEEIEEMLDGTDAEDLNHTMGYPGCVYLADKPRLAKAVSARIEKTIGDKTGSPAFDLLSQVAEALAKAAASVKKSGATQTQEWGEHGTAEFHEDDSWVGRAAAVGDHVHESMKAAQDIQHHADTMMNAMKAAGGDLAKSDGHGRLTKIHKSAGDIVERCMAMKECMKGSKVTLAKAKKEKEEKAKEEDEDEKEKSEDVDANDHSQGGRKTGPKQAAKKEEKGKDKPEEDEEEREEPDEAPEEGGEKKGKKKASGGSEVTLETVLATMQELQKSINDRTRVNPASAPARTSVIEKGEDGATARPPAEQASSDPKDTLRKAMATPQRLLPGMQLPLDEMAQKIK